MSLSKLFAKAFSPKYLVFTNTGLAGICLVGSDYLQQNLEHYVILKKDSPRTHNYQRSCAMFANGLGFGVLGHYWYKLLDTKLPGNSKGMVLKKVAAECCLSPVFLAIFFLGVGALEGHKMIDSWNNYTSNLKFIIFVEVCMWAPLQTFNFLYLKPKYRMLYVGIAMIAYDVFLSYISHRKVIEKEQ